MIQTENGSLSSVSRLEITTSTTLYHSINLLSKNIYVHVQTSLTLFKRSLWQKTAHYSPKFKKSNTIKLFLKILVRNVKSSKQMTEK